MAKCANDEYVEGFVIAPSGQLSHGSKGRHDCRSKLSPFIEVGGDWEIIQEAAPKNDRSNRAVHVVRHQEEPPAADAPGIVSEGQRDRRHGAGRPTRLPAKPEARPSVVLHIARCEIEDSPQVRRGFVVHSDETFGAAEVLRLEGLTVRLI